VFRLQGFPESFKIPVSNNQAYKQAGNAVPVKVVEKICAKIIDTLIGNKKVKSKKVA
jgi:DNA (cytosine-5)-methyltransferase 1